MLYPKEDERNLKLQFTCRTCQFTEDAKTTCVFRNNLNNSAGETAGVTQDVGSDPTVSDISCLRCGCIVCCNSCGQSDPRMTVVWVEEDARRSAANPSKGDLADMIMSVANGGFWEEEYDEEMFSEPDYSLGSDDTLGSSTSEGTACTNTST